MSAPDSRSIKSAPTSGKPGSVARRVAKWTAIGMGIIVGLPLLLLAGLTLWLTPERLTDLVNREGSKYLNADIHARDVDYTLWSTFPRFRISTGEVTVTSRTLNNIPASILEQLPDSAEFLGAVKGFSGEINVVDLFMNRYVIHDVNVDGLRLNLVAYNDSINNYDIIPSGGAGFKRVPYISAESISLRNPGTMRYFSADTDTRASLDLNSFSLARRRGKGVGKNTYRLRLLGNVTASSAGIGILDRFPFELDGDLNLRFNPFGISLTDYSIDLGELKSRLSMSVGIGDDPKVESFDYRISDVSLSGLLGYIPKEFVPSLQGLRADVEVNASARLLSAWTISSEEFPSIAVDFTVPAGEMAYTLTIPSQNGAGGREAIYQLRHSPIAASFVFDGRHPDESYLKVKDFKVMADGLDLSMGATVTRLTSHPLVVADVAVNADVARSLRLLPFTPPVKAAGDVSLSSSISFSVAELSKEGLEKGLSDVDLTALLTARGMSVEAPSLGLKGTVGNVTLNISETSDMLNAGGMANPRVELSGSVASANLHLQGASAVKAGKISFATSSAYQGMLTPDILMQGLPVEVEGELRDVKYADPVTGTSAELPLLKFTDRLSKHTGDPAFDLLSDGVAISAPFFSYTVGKDHFMAHNVNFRGKLSMRAPSKPGASGKSGVERSAISEGLLRIDIPAGLRQFLDGYALHCRLQTSKIDILTPGFHRGNYLSDIDLTVDEEDVRLANVSFMLERTRARLQANLGNLRGFLLNPPSASNPLQADLTLALDTVNINALARAYVESKGGMQNIPKPEHVTASDSIALLMPRNISGKLRLSADELLYTNLDLTDLRADIDFHDGLLRIPDLGLASSFGSAALDVSYDSRDKQAMALGVGLDINKIDIVKFFKKFPSLIRMMPEMRNLSGTISANVDFRTDIFPDMYINMPSASAELTVEGRGLTVKQSHFIRRITRMMLIESGDPIHIHDMDVHASFHDNLLQLDPFNFEFDRYRIRMLGVNNLNGDLYYHIAADKSPVPFPFSVNIEGQFRHPKLRFGGGRYDDRHAERITSQIQEENNINMTLILRKLLRLFVGEAAKY